MVVHGRYLATGGDIRVIVTGDSVIDWVAHRCKSHNRLGADVGIGWAKNDCFDPSGKKFVGYETIHVNLPHLVAGVAYANWNGVNVECHIASDGSKRWLTREYLWAIFDYPFNQLGAQRITVCVAAGNADSCRFVKHLGFTIEAKLEAAHPTGDILIFCMKRQDCRFIQTRSQYGQGNINASAA